MSYRLDPRLFVENGPAALAAKAEFANHSSLWRSLGPARRLAAIETMLSPANDCGPPLPIAL